MSEYKDSDDSQYDPGAFFNFGHGESHEGVRRDEIVIDSVYESSAKDEIRTILQKALGDLPQKCPDCNGMCQHHVVAVRDAFMYRAGELGTKLLEGLSLYRLERRFGLQEPEDLIKKIYDIWAEMSVLYALAEPQDVSDEVTIIPPGLELPDQDDEGSAE